MCDTICNTPRPNTLAMYLLFDVTQFKSSLFNIRLMSLHNVVDSHVKRCMCDVLYELRLHRISLVQEMEFLIGRTVVVLGPPRLVFVQGNAFDLFY